MAEQGNALLRAERGPERGAQTQHPAPSKPHPGGADLESLTDQHDGRQRSADLPAFARRERHLEALAGNVSGSALLLDRLVGEPLCARSHHHIGHLGI